MKRTTSTAYLTFSNENEYKDFFNECNGHIFLDEKGVSYKMQIEIALFQKIPSKKSKIPEIVNTYTETEDYKKFLENLNKESKPISVELLEEEKIEKQIAPLVLELNETVNTKENIRNRRHRKGKKPQKEEVKYVIKKRLTQPEDTKPNEISEKSNEENFEDKNYDEKGYGKGKSGNYQKGKNGGQNIIYRKKQPNKEDTK